MHQMIKTDGHQDKTGDWTDKIDIPEIKIGFQHCSQNIKTDHKKASRQHATSEWEEAKYVQNIMIKEIGKWYMMTDT